MDSQIPSSNSAESGEVIEGRVLSDEEVIRMESKERMDANTQKVIREQDRFNNARLMNLYMYYSKNPSTSSFFRDL